MVMKFNSKAAKPTAKKPSSSTAKKRSVPSKKVRKFAEGGDDSYDPLAKRIGLGGMARGSAWADDYRTPTKAEDTDTDTDTGRPTASAAKGAGRFTESAKEATGTVRAIGAAAKRALAPIGERLSSESRYQVPGVPRAAKRPTSLKESADSSAPSSRTSSLNSPSRDSDTGTPGSLGSAPAKAKAKADTSAPSKPAAKPESKPAAKPESKPAAKSKADVYPVYQKGSASAKSFGKAFNEARDKGLKVFSWKGADGIERKYTTKLK